MKSIIAVLVLSVMSLSAQAPKIEVNDVISLAIMPAIKGVKYSIQYSLNGGKTWWEKTCVIPRHSTNRLEVKLQRPTKKIMFRVRRRLN